ncbi:(Fe-S)-binding protein [Lysobacter helvus]|uniref:(Fe-S)-binding protein n=2 Tax=Lysobacteraceae TaxID=32033 RepID=A0ABM7Q1R2_9GAMM|nr:MULTISPECIES: aromatic ring-hydroxylating dioxygenase subunit alpha [Lysobacter]BCT91162.1 (Fe-S)-binding protein [Lysobacter caseinilyticus]BCT94315.1 (Fe-S)-binding protein [Lysobacter helvus]
MGDWHPALFSHWYAVARSRDVRKAPHAITVLDLPIVLARSDDGRVYALEDRCPHRHAPLSAGCRTAQGIACPYHGWTFGADGAVQRIPGLPDDVALPAVRARAFATHEHDGIVWLRPGDEGDAMPGAFVQALDPAHRRFLWRTTWDAHVVDAMENFMDPMHTHSIHAGLVRGGARAPATATVRADGEGLSVEYSGQVAQSGLLYRLFESPRTSEHVHFAPPGSAQIAYRYRDGAIVRITLHFTPRNARQTDVVATLHVENRWAPAWAVRWFVWPFLRRVGEQDRRMLAMQARNLERFPGRRGASTSLDVLRPFLEAFWLRGERPASAPARSVPMML